MFCRGDPSCRVAFKQVTVATPTMQQHRKRSQRTFHHVHALKKDGKSGIFRQTNAFVSHLKRVNRKIMYGRVDVAVQMPLFVPEDKRGMLNRAYNSRRAATQLQEHSIVIVARELAQISGQTKVQNIIIHTCTGTPYALTCDFIIRVSSTSIRAFVL